MSISIPDSLIYTFNDLTYSFIKKKESINIINNLTGSIRKNKLTAIMGSSGAGKTTFIDLLANRSKKGHVRGNLQLNSKSSFRDIGSYVLQKDLVMGTQTIYETLMFYGRLHLNLSYSGIKEQVDSLTSMLGLDKCKDTIIGTELERGVSGGELKRVSIGISLISEPSILILDEPTSGLDSHNALNIINILKNLSITVICTIHQPSSDIFNLFDDLILMDKGELVYIGEIKSCRKYMERNGHKCEKYYNPADFYIRTILEDADSTLLDKWKLSAEYKALEKTELVTPGVEEGQSAILETMEDNKYTASPLKQFKYLAYREFKNTTRDPRIYIGGFIKAIFLGLVAGSLYFQIDDTYDSIQDRFGILFFIAINQAFSGQTYLLKYIEERDLFTRERAAGYYTVLPYFFAKTIMELPPMILFPVITATITYWMAGLNSSFEAFVLFTVVIMLHAIVSLSIFVFLGSICPNANLALMMAPLVITLFFMFAGFFIKMENIPVYYQWFGYLSFFKYTSVVLASVEFSGQLYQCNITDNINSTLCVNGTYSGDREVEIFNVDHFKTWECYLILASMIVIYRLGTVLAIWVLHKEKR